MTATTIKTCPNGLRKTMLVSFPRSGHHLLVRGLTEALDHKLVYSEYYTCAHNMSNCQYVNLQKSHDFDLTDPIDPELNYIVLHRKFEPAVKSWYLATKPDMTFEDFKESKREYYKGFMAKWWDYEVESYPENFYIGTFDCLLSPSEGEVEYFALTFGQDCNYEKVKEYRLREGIAHEPYVTYP